MTSLTKLFRSLDAPTALSRNILPSKKEWTRGNKLPSSNLVVSYKIGLGLLENWRKLSVNITFWGLTTYLIYGQHL